MASATELSPIISIYQAASQASRLIDGNSTDLIHMSIHRLRPRLPAFQPALRTIHVRILAKHALILVQHPGIQSDPCIARKPLAVDLCSRRWHVARDVESDSRADAHRFLQSGLKVGELLRFGIGDEVGETSLSV